jgi:hypothetical protein
MQPARGAAAWQKLGRVYDGAGNAPWAESHAYLPTPGCAAAGRLPVYCAALSADRVGRVGRIDLDAADPLRVVRPLHGPVLDVGPPGSFDDSGVSPTCIVEDAGATLLYYFGWQRSVRVPYLLFGGLAISHDGGETFARCGDAPILDRTAAEPFGRSAPMVLRDGPYYRMWYVSVLGWIAWKGALVPTYDIRHLVSDDGRDWRGDGEVCVAPRRPDEFGLGRPWVARGGPGFQMWFSIRSLSHPYRLGYAESADGLRWTRLDDRAGLAASDAGWDSEMVCFAAVRQVGDRRYMFYNGNDHGATGFGCAVAELAG